ncbi:MAG: hypothetical protein K8T91_19185, partial [Planctomycetes bacterium]|nr:hypothetical protein [Planctomycetota bacterium]
TVAPQRAFGNKELKLHSEHEVRYMLSQSDLTEMDSASRALVTFRKVSLDEYRKQDETAPAKR